MNIKTLVNMDGNSAYKWLIENWDKYELTKKQQATSDSQTIKPNIDIFFTPYMPVHGNFSDCCGIFTHFDKRKGFCCNECGLSLNELIDGLASNI